MKLAIFAIVAFMLVGCTNTHRMLVLYESDEAVRGNLQIIERESTNVVQEKKNETSEAGIVDTIRNQLP